MIPLIAWYAIAIIVMIAIAGVVLVIARASGVAIPPWVIQIFWIIVIAVVGIVAIKFLLTLL